MTKFEKIDMLMKVIVTGTTGYVGEGIMLSCLEDPRVDKVLSVSRKSVNRSHPKLEEYIVEDFMSLQPGDPRLQGYDAVLFCAGISSVGTPMDKYAVICHDIPMQFARAVGPVEKMTFFYLSGYGTSDANPQQWAKIKHSTEKELAEMPFKAVYWYRPCFMKAHKDQQFRKSFAVSTALLYPLTRLIGMANTIQEVASSMVSLTADPIKQREIGVSEIRRLAKE